MTNNHIEDILFKFTEVILLCENIIEKEYGLNSIPYLNQKKIPRTAKLQHGEVQLEYRFHGSGCALSVGKIELDYCIYPDRENYIVVSPWGLYCFINTYLKTENAYTETQVAEWLNMLNAKKIIHKIYEGYLVYEISFEWYNEFKTDIHDRHP